MNCCRMFLYSRRKLSKRACKSASASNGVLPPLPAPPAPPVPPAPPAPSAAACGCLAPVAIDNDPEA